MVIGRTAALLAAGNLKEVDMKVLLPVAGSLKLVLDSWAPQQVAGSLRKEIGKSAAPQVADSLKLAAGNWWLALQKEADRWMLEDCHKNLGLVTQVGYRKNQS